MHDAVISEGRLVRETGGAELGKGSQTATATLPSEWQYSLIISRVERCRI